MSWITHPSALCLRSFLRQTRITKLITRLVFTNEYEKIFCREILRSIRPGDCVWDVGANVGFYTTRFLEVSGPNGQIVAFEPSPMNRERLTEVVAGCPRVMVRPEALGAVSGQVSFYQGDDSIGATSRIDTSDLGEDSITVTLNSGDNLIEKGLVPTPNLIKIDTEGHELEVLIGLSKTLYSLRLQTVCVEVHFGLLAARGQSDAPAEIEMRLRQAGFSTRWTDASHIVGRRLEAAI